MKKHILKEDLSMLQPNQQKSLRQLWLPEKYDLAVAYICTNAETEEFDEIEFVVGNVILYNTHFILSDLRSLPDNEGTEINENDDESVDQSSNEDENNFGSDEDSSEEAYEENSEEDDSFDNFDSSYQRPTTFVKEDCLPLFTIGQMIEILIKTNYKAIDFYLLADNGETACQIGNNAFNLSGYGSDFESKELCDVLWNCIIKIL